MAKFTITLFTEGSRVAVTGGDYKGQTGTVTAWQRIGEDHPDPLHHIVLDAPIKVDPRVYKRTDGALVEEPAHEIATIEVVSSQLADA